MIKVPCKGCTDRVMKCHSTCERYKEYRAALEKLGEKAQKTREINDAHYDNRKRMLHARSKVPKYNP